MLKRRRRRTSPGGRALLGRLRFALALASQLLGVVSLAAADHRGAVRFGGLPLPGATITASQGNTRFTSVSDSQGVYSFLNVPDGVWTLRVEMSCFTPIVREVDITPNVPALEWDMSLLPPDQLQAIVVLPPAAAPASTVTEGRPQPDTRTAATAVVLNSPSTDTRSRGMGARTEPPAGFQRTTLEPAMDAGGIASEDQARSADDLTQEPSEALLINGSVNDAGASPFALSPAIGNNRRVFRSLYTGSLAWVVDHSALDARSFSLTGQNTPKPDYARMRGVAAFGGPLRIPRILEHNRPSFTLNYEWVRNRIATTSSTLLPDAGMRRGDFSNLTGPLGKPVIVFDPATGTPFAGNAIPEDRISPQARHLLNYYPSPNFSASTRYNYQIPLVSSFHQDSLQSRISRSLGRGDQISGSFAWQSTRRDATDLFGFLDTADALGFNASVNWTRRFATHFLLTLGYRFSRQSSSVMPYFAYRDNVSATAGITGNNQDPANWGPPALTFSSGIAGLSDVQRSSTHNQASAVSASVSWVRGRHNIKLGGDFRRQQFNVLAQQDARGSFTFTGAATKTPNGGSATATGSDFADFLLGIPEASSIAFGNADKYFRGSGYDWYIDEDWRAGSRLTVKAGLRWEYNSPLTELYGRLVNLDIAPGFSAVTPVLSSQPRGPLTGRLYPDSLIRASMRSYQPRLGVAWRPFSVMPMVVRAGYGIYYDTSIYQSIADRMAQQWPLSTSLRVQNNMQNPLTLANGFRTAGAAPNTYAVDPNLRVGYAQNWTLAVQQDVFPGMILTASYLGTKGTRSLQEILPNTYPLNAEHPIPSYPAGYAYLMSNGNSIRHAAQLQLRRRLRNGFTAQLQYTYAKSIDNAALGGSGQGLIAQDWLDLRSERARSNFDQRHLLTLDLQYTTGMGIGGGTLRGGWKGRTFKDWTFAAELKAGSGLPLTPIYPALVTGTGVIGSLRPDYTGLSIYAAPPGLFLNPAAVTEPGTGRWGNAGRNSITGPGQFSLNTSLSRTLRVSDRISCDIRVDAINSLNHVTFPSWNTTLGSPQFGLPGSANPMRNVQTMLRARF